MKSSIYAQYACSERIKELFILRSAPYETAVLVFSLAIYYRRRLRRRRRFVSPESTHSSQSQIESR